VAPRVALVAGRRRGGSALFLLPRHLLPQLRAHLLRRFQRVYSAALSGTHSIRCFDDIFLLNKAFLAHSPRFSATYLAHGEPRSSFFSVFALFALLLASDSDRRGFQVILDRAAFRDSSAIYFAQNDTAVPSYALHMPWMTEFRERRPPGQAHAKFFDIPLFHDMATRFLLESICSHFFFAPSLGYSLPSGCDTYREEHGFLNGPGAGQGEWPSPLVRYYHYSQGWPIPELSADATAQQNQRLRSEWYRDAFAAWLQGGEQLRRFVREAPAPPVHVHVGIPVPLSALHFPADSLTIHIAPDSREFGSDFHEQTAEFVKLMAAQSERFNNDTVL
jgi:hypothetical protein